VLVVLVVIMQVLICYFLLETDAMRSYAMMAVAALHAPKPLHDAAMHM
jgi:hypothetical protein